jgi:hypothetical protein
MHEFKNINVAAISEFSKVLRLVIVKPALEKVLSEVAKVAGMASKRHASILIWGKELHCFSTITMDREALHHGRWMALMDGHDKHRFLVSIQRVISC